MGISILNYGGVVGSGWGTDARCEVGGENNQYGDRDGDNDCRFDTTHNTIRQNLIYNLTHYHGGIVIWYASDVRVINNTVHNIQDGPAIQVGRNRESEIIQCCSQIEIQGNIFSESDRGAINIESIEVLLIDSHNLIHQPGDKIDYVIGETQYSLAEYQTMTGRGQGSNSANPLFVDSDNGDFQLQTDSPAIDAGVDVGLETDLNGNPSPQGSGYDMGVYEATF